MPLLYPVLLIAMLLTSRDTLHLLFGTNPPAGAIVSCFVGNILIVGTVRRPPVSRSRHAWQRCAYDGGDAVAVNIP